MWNNYDDRLLHLISVDWMLSILNITLSFVSTIGAIVNRAKTASNKENKRNRWRARRKLGSKHFEVISTQSILTPTVRPNKHL